MSTLPVLSLKRRGSELANARRQVELLEQPSDLARFEDVLGEHKVSGVQALSLIHI